MQATPKARPNTEEWFKKFRIADTQQTTLLASERLTGSRWASTDLSSLPVWIAALSDVLKDV